MRVQAVKSFFDKKEGVTRSRGDAFTVSQERFKEINSTRAGQLVEAAPPESKKTRKAPTTQGAG